MIVANLDGLLEDAGYKLVWPRRSTDGRRNPGPNHSRRPSSARTRSVVFSRPLPASDHRCLECHTPIQSDDFGGVCFGCYQEV